MRLDSGRCGRVRVSKLEPHVLGGPPPDVDVDQFLSDLDEQSQDVDAAHEATDQPLESDISDGGAASEGFVRLADFLKKKMAQNGLKKHPNSRRSVAISAYQFQKEFHIKMQKSGEDDVLYHLAKTA